MGGCRGGRLPRVTATSEAQAEYPGLTSQRAPRALAALPTPPHFTSLHTTPPLYTTGICSAPLLLPYAYCAAPAVASPSLYRVSSLSSVALQYCRVPSLSVCRSRLHTTGSRHNAHNIT